MISDGRDLDDSITSNTIEREVASTNPEGLLMKEFTEWANATKSVMNKWVNDAEDPFIKRSLLAFLTIGVRTVLEFVHDIELNYEHGEIPRKEYKNMIKSLKNDREHFSTYLMELLLSHVTYYHIYQFSNEYNAILKENKLTFESFLDKLYDAKGLNWKGSQRYNSELRSFGKHESKGFAKDFLSLVGMTKENNKLISLTENAFKKSYGEMMPELVNDTIKTKLLG